MNECIKRAGLLLLVLPVAAALALSGCGQDIGRPQPPSKTPTAVATPTPAAKSLEGAYDRAHMAEFLDAVLPMVGQFFKAAYPNLPAPRLLLLVRTGEGGASACGAYDSWSYEYCPANDSIYIGQDLLWAFYRIGDAAPVVGIAHEWGHHLQAALSLPEPRTAVESVGLEDQADCIAGAWEKYAGERGWLEVPDDVGDSTRLMEAIGSRETRIRDHGTTAERLNALRSGYAGGLKGCNAFVPSVPIAG